MDYNIIHLPKEQWKGTIIPIRYTTNEYYDVIVNKKQKGFNIDIEKKSAHFPITHSPEEYDFPDKLYEDYRQNAFAWGVVENNKLIAVIETDVETWFNRLRITELWVSEEHHKKGLGKKLVDIAKEQARIERRRAIILETQSCNVNAIDFYISQGFTLIGFDSCCYSNNDLERKEVRLEFGWFPEKKPKLKREDIEIRMETEEDFYNVEVITQRAFWNKHQMGCDEHYLVNNIRKHKDYIPEISRIAVKDGEIIGAIFYTKSKLVDEDGQEHEVLTFGPLSVDPKWQGCGVGEILTKETMKLAKDRGYKGIIIFGEPDYYPRLGFKTCDKFNITTSEGKNFDAFMGIELIKDGFKNISGKFFESDVFTKLSEEVVDEYNKHFPRLEKIKFPGQWA